MNKNNEFIFPNPITPHPEQPQGGLTKRELFAAMALQGLMAMPTRDGEDMRYKVYARAAVKEADALLAELAKTESEVA